MKNSKLVADHFSHIRAGVKTRAGRLPFKFNRDDLVGVVLVRVVQEAPRYDAGRSTFKTWLQGRMAGAVVDAIRVMTPGTRGYPATETQLRRPDLLPDETTVQAGAARVLRDVLAKMPSRWRRVLELRYLEDQAAAETAAALGVSEWTVVQDTRRGLAQMRIELERRGVRKVADVL